MRSMVGAALARRSLLPDETTARITDAYEQLAAAYEELAGFTHPRYAGNGRRGCRHHPHPRFRFRLAGRRSTITIYRYPGA